VKAPQGKPSHVWKVICKAYSTLKDGFSVRIGNEASNVWFDNWTRTEPLCTKVVYDDIQGVDLTLSNLITGGKWNLGKKVIILNDEVIKSFISHPPILHHDVHDSFAWDGNKNGIYTTHSAYAWLQN